MEALEFVTNVRDRVVENDNEVYKNLLDSTREATGPTWRGVLSIYKNLSESEQLAFLRFLGLIQVNTVSHVFGILDGSTF